MQELRVNGDRIALGRLEGAPVARVLSGSAAIGRA